MSEEIQPALTAEEWAAKRIERGDDTWSGAGPIAAIEGDGLLCAMTYGYEESRSGWEGKDRHALAALCLYGQPFGFSREDVRLLHAAGDSLLGLVKHDDTYGDNSLLARGNFCYRLAARIASLLPPDGA